MNLRKAFEVFLAVSFAVITASDLIAIVRFFVSNPPAIREQLLHFLTPAYWTVKVIEMATAGFYTAGYFSGMEKKHLAVTSFIFVILRVLAFALITIHVPQVLSSLKSYLINAAVFYVAGLATGYNLMSQRTR